MVQHRAEKTGHWVVVQLEGVTGDVKIAGVKLIAWAYTWSQTSIAYFNSTCGVTTRAKEPYFTEYEDNDGQIQQRSYPRPQLVSDYYNTCTYIDDGNKLRQHHLALEKKWPTKDS